MGVGVSCKPNPNSQTKDPKTNVSCDCRNSLFKGLRLPRTVDNKSLDSISVPEPKHFFCLEA